jgi:DNA primase
MITKETVDRILDAARIEEVVGDFVALKKRGSNWLGLCPFHNEKTPSFNVSPSRNIYKCFGCGKAGNAVSFIMEHEHYSYPEALKYLASRYGIEVEETQEEPQDKQAELERESLFIVNQFARQFYSDYLFHSEEGRAVGLSYFAERGFDEETIRKFELGLAPEDWDALLRAATAKGYSRQVLLKAGLITEVRNDRTGEIKYYDRFRNRVIFPIHNLSGKTIAFGARILKHDPKAPKYLNSPETEIYHKSKILYGIYFAKKAIIEKDECYLTEGYTDVISLHREGIANAVASSGTSLTVEQIRLIARYTKNITILYDGDAAGIKASLRGIDLILEQGLNVRVVLFPDGEDPDSYARKNSRSALHEFITGNKKDFITFKTGLLIQEAGNDPLSRAALIREVVESISKVPDSISREMYIRQCSVLLNVTEQTLIFEINKIRRKQLEKTLERDVQQEAGIIIPEEFETKQEITDWHSSVWQEAEIIRLLVNYFDEPISVSQLTEEGQQVHHFRTGEFILAQLQGDEIEFEDGLYKRMMELIISYGAGFQASYLVSHEDPEIREKATGMMTDRYDLAQWKKWTGIEVKTEKEVLSKQVLSAVYMIKTRKLLSLIKENNLKIKDASETELVELVRERMELEAMKKELAGYLGIVVLK